MPRLTTLLLLCSLASSTAFAQAAPRDARSARMREYLAAAASLGQLNGSVLVAERGKVLIDTAYGFANMELGVRNTPETRFRVASITKQFTAMAVMMLAEAGKLSLADPISKWVDSVPPAWRALTIHQLLRHTSGISDYEEWFDGYTTQAYSDYMSQAHAPARIVRDAMGRPLDHEPGTKFRYSNSAYVVLGYIVERASGMPYGEFVRRRIHEPLGMTGSDQDRSEHLIANRAQGYRFRPGAYPVAFFNGLSRADHHNAFYQLMEPPQADAGLITTARDLYKWDQALYGQRLVKQAALDSIFSPGIGGYGYGWFVETGVNGRTHEHSGGLPGFSAYIMRMPETRRSVIVLNNIERSGPIERDLAAILRGAPVALPRARRIVANDNAPDSARAGMYRNAAGDSVRVFVEDGRIGVHQPGRFRVGLLSEGPNQYFSPQLRGEVRFTEAAGRITITVRDALGNPLIVAERLAAAGSSP
ncbi:MAG TPA: serine hydrolase domain-containing protein [Gemmatimonadaceae bacterium]|nr:serine hydrolase domain-containing protein [Gemmatimonadaceae bacterium]